MINFFRGDKKVVQAGNIVTTLWLDNRVVLMMSTNTQPLATGVVQRRLTDGSRANVECPEAMVLYNKYMGGVHLNDQLHKYYHVPLKSRKCYCYILFEVSVTYEWWKVSKSVLHISIHIPVLMSFFQLSIMFYVCFFLCHFRFMSGQIMSFLHYIIMFYVFHFRLMSV